MLYLIDVAYLIKCARKRSLHSQPMRKFTYLARGPIVIKIVYILWCHTTEIWYRFYLTKSVVLPENKDKRKLLDLFDTKKPSSTQKCMVRHKNAWFGTKMLSSTQKCHTYQLSLPLSIIPHPILCAIFFPILFKYFVFKNPQRWQNETFIFQNI